jgi:hypothetical protein
LELEAKGSGTTFRFFYAKIAFALSKAPDTRFLVRVQDH